MQFFCILFFKQFDAFGKVFSKCFNKFDVHSFIISNIRPLRGGGQVVNAQIMYFISSPIFLRFSPSDLPVVLMILRKKQSQKVSQKGPGKKVNNCGKLGLTAWGI
jgi:hypothetical protein